MPRDYTHHTTATVRHLRLNYHRQPMKELAAELGITLSKLYDLADRQGIKKNKGRGEERV